MRKPLTFLAVVLAVVTLTAGVAAQSPPRLGAPPTIVVVEARPTSSLDGATLFQAYCTSCHGRNGRGDGPAASVIPTPVPDLTQISATHPGTDCYLHVLADLTAGHRSAWEPKVSERDLDMPNWGPMFRALSANPDFGHLRLRNVSRYVATIQAQR